jgi:5'-methylthioadenosine phosphorylase
MSSSAKGIESTAKESLYPALTASTARASIRRSSVMIGIIGGTILIERRALDAPEPRDIGTPYGSAEVDVGQLSGVPVALVQRHGRRRDRPPHRINHPANLSALQSLGVSRVIGLGSTGCLRADVDLPALIVPHDYINFFESTVFDDRLVHVTPGFDEELRRTLIEEARGFGQLPLLDRGVYFQQRGPRLDTRAEVAFMGTLADCVGMTVASEATVARELGLAYAALCTLDNYAHGVRDRPVDQADIQANASRNASACLEVLARVVQRLSA